MLRSGYSSGNFCGTFRDKIGILIVRANDLGVSIRVCKDTWGQNCRTYNNGLHVISLTLMAKTE